MAVEKKGDTIGYYVNIVDSTARMPRRFEAEAYAALCELNKHDGLKRGGSWQGGKQVASWFSWMPADYPAECPTVAAILKALGFTCEEDAEYLHIYFYDSKTGQEDLFLRTLAPYLEGRITWQGEEGEQWREEYALFSHPKLFKGVVSWVECE